MSGNFVSSGAEIECKLCSNPKGELIVTSNTIVMGNDPWATEADKGKQNLIFKGTCGKFNTPPPPCISVIKPGNWQGVSDGIEVQNNLALLESSTIICNTGGVPITITNAGQSLGINKGDAAQVLKKEAVYVEDIKGPSEIKAGQVATYVITKYHGTPTEEEKESIKWSVYIDGKKDNRIGFINEKQEIEDSNTDLYTADVKDKRLILYAKVSCSEDKFEVKFSKWLDGTKIKVEAHKNARSFDVKCQQETEIKANPEIIAANWCDDDLRNIKIVGYKQKIFIHLKTLGLSGQSIDIDVYDYDYNHYKDKDDQIDWKNNTVTINERDTYKEFVIQKQEDKPFASQRGGFEGSDLELYFTLPSQKSTTGWEEKYGKYLNLTTKEKVTAAYFAEQKERTVLTTDASKEDSEKTSEKEEEPKLVTHTVGKNDNKSNLSSIARLYKKVTWKQIAKANGLEKPFAIYKGDVLIIPQTIPETPESKPKEEAKTEPSKEKYYQKINKAYLGTEVYVVLQSVNLQGKTASVEIYENNAVLESEGNNSLPVLKEGTEVTTLENLTFDAQGQAVAKIALRRKSDESYKKWQDKLKESKARLWLEVSTPIWYGEQQIRFLIGEELEVVGGVSVEEARVRAFLRMIRVGEGTVGEIGYETLFGGSSFIKNHNKNWDDHPEIHMPFGNTTSTAAGAYQVMGYVWNDYNMISKRKKYLIKDFTPLSQDRFAIIILKYKRKGLVDLIIKGNIEEALVDKASYEWASLPPGRYGQPAKTLNQALKIYNDFLEEELKGNSDLFIQNGFLERFKIMPLQN